LVTRKITTSYQTNILENHSHNPAHWRIKDCLIKIGSCLAIIRYWCIVFLYAQANSDIIDAVYVSTDDSTIKAIALTFGAQVIDRPYFREILNQPFLFATRTGIDS
jgi:hypothetical protein